MEINVIEKSKNRILFEIIGEGHSLANAMRHELYSDKDVINAGYVIEHPDLGIPKFLIETKTGKDSLNALQKAIKRLKKQNTEFLSTFLKQVK